MEEVRDLVPVVVEFKATAQVERASVPFAQLDGAGLVDRAAVEQGPKHRLPADPGVEGTAGHLHLGVHRQAHGGLPVLDQIREGVGPDRRDRIGRALTFVKDQLAVLLAQADGSALDLEPKGRKLLVQHAPSRQLAVALDGIGQDGVEDLVASEVATVAATPGPAVDGHGVLLVARRPVYRRQ